MPRSLPELESYLEGLPEPHIMFDRDYRIVAANAAYRQRFSPQASVIGRHCYEVSHQFDAPCDQSGESCPLTRARASQQRERIVHLHHTPQGEAYVQIELVPLRNARGEMSYFVEKMAPLPASAAPVAAPGLIGRAPAFQQMLDLVARVGPSNASVLLLGESGTGKELVARAVHDASARAGAPLVVVECASLTETLLESELFGHERGAFTGANAAKPGLVESANGGTLFLDEVGDIPLPIQVKLLRLLESGTYRRVGSVELRHTDVRIVCATHRDLLAMVADGRFRQDLYYRLSTFPIRLPPLRERAEDIPALAQALLARVAPQRALRLSEGAMQGLARHGFPGNVRELRNLLERAALLCDGPVIEDGHVQRALAADTLQAPSPQAAAALARAPAVAAASTGSLRDLARETLRAQLQTHEGTRAELAQRLGISERSLYRRLQALKAQAPDSQGLTAQADGAQSSASGAISRSRFDSARRQTPT